MDIRGVFPGVVLHSIAFPLDEKAESTTEHFAIQDFFDQVLVFSFDKFGWRRQFRSSSDYRVGRSGSEFYHIKNRMEAAHWVRQFETVGVLRDLSLYRVGA